MLRLLVGGLLLSSLRRTSAAHSSHALRSSAIAANTCRNINTVMEQPFEKMAEEGVPKCDAPSKVAAPQKEEQALPKMSAQEFRVYNRMSEHMDMYVSIYQSTSISLRRRHA